MTRTQIHTIDASTLSFDFFFALNDAVSKRLAKKKMIRKRTKKLSSKGGEEEHDK